jgi:hypothetical protein
MEKEIELKRSNIARITDREPFVLPDELVLKFNSLGYDLTNAFIVLQNGSQKAMYPLRNPFKVPNDILYSGILEIGIKAYKGGTKIKDWVCSPIRIKEADQGLICFDFLYDLEQRLAKVEEALVTKKDHNILVEKHNELADTVSEIKEKFKEL